jgi:hypothetical protein
VRVKEAENGRRQHVGSEEREVVSLSDAGDHARFLGDRRRRFFEHRFDRVEVIAAVDALAADDAEVRQLALRRHLNT